MFGRRGSSSTSANNSSGTSRRNNRPVSSAGSSSSSSGASSSSSSTSDGWVCDTNRYGQTYYANGTTGSTQFQHPTYHVAPGQQSYGTVRYVPSARYRRKPLPVPPGATTYFFPADPAMGVAVAEPVPLQRASWSYTTNYPLHTSTQTMPSASPLPLLQLQQQPGAPILPPRRPEERVECPLCFRLFPKSTVEIHASTCTGSEATSNEPLVDANEVPATTSMLSGLRLNNPSAPSLPVTYDEPAPSYSEVDELHSPVLEPLQRSSTLPANMGLRRPYYYSVPSRNAASNARAGFLPVVAETALVRNLDTYVILKFVIALRMLQRVLAKAVEVHTKVNLPNDQSHWLEDCTQLLITDVTNDLHPHILGFVGCSTPEKELRHAAKNQGSSPSNLVVSRNMNKKQARHVITSAIIIFDGLIKPILKYYHPQGIPTMFLQDTAANFDRLQGACFGLTSAHMNVDWKDSQGNPLLRFKVPFTRSHHRSDSG